MPRTRPPYPPAFRAEAVRLIRSGQKHLSEISRGLGVSDQTLRNWVRQEDVDEGSREGLTSSGKEEPPPVELFEGQPGTLWHTPNGPLLHHVGAFTYEPDRVRARDVVDGEHRARRLGWESGHINHAEAAGLCTMSCDRCPRCPETGQCGQ